MTIVSRAVRLLRRALLVCLFSVLAACSGSGGGGGPTAPSGMVTFTADHAAAAGSFALRTGAGTQGTHLVLELVANGVQDVGQVTFVFTYPTNLLRFSGQGQGPFLTQGNALALLLATQLPAPLQGVLVVDSRPSGVVGVSGSGVVLTLQLDGIGTGNGRIDLEAPEALDSQDQPIAGLDWIGGAISVVL